MKFSINKLKFTGPVHFGGDNALSLESAQMGFCADTLFSALCHTARIHGGVEGVERLCAWAKEGLLLLSDAMPWREGKEDILYLPRPFLAPVKRGAFSPEKGKAMKKIRYLPVDRMDEYIRSLYGGETADLTGIDQHFGASQEITRARTPEEGDTLPYFVGVYWFEKDCGLYFIMGCAHEAMEEEIQRYLALLQYSGIGGKISSGMGKFEVEDQIDLSEPFDGQTQWLSQALSDDGAPIQMTLSACLPLDEELDKALEGAQYQMIRRGGFVGEPVGAEGQGKKKSQYVFQAGSTFAGRFAGQVSDVGQWAEHKVYRYNRPIWLGVKP